MQAVLIDNCWQRAAWLPRRARRWHAVAAAPPVAAAAAHSQHARQGRPSNGVKLQLPITNELGKQTRALQALTSWASAELPCYTKDSVQQWQPADSLAGAFDGVLQQQAPKIYAEALQLPSDVLVVLAGMAVNACTLPLQWSQWQTIPVLGDNTDVNPWIRWYLSWAAERDEHRRLLLSYCYACGCLDMQAVQNTVQISFAARQRNSSSNSNTSKSNSSCSSDLPYQQLMTSMLQARMSRVMATGLSRVSAYHGVTQLAGLATSIAADESRHELAQVAALSQVFAADPEGAVIAFAQVVQQGVLLPGCCMDDGWHKTAKLLEVATTSSNISGSRPLGAESTLRRHSQMQQQKTHDQPAEHSQLYLDFMAAADVLGVWTVDDMASAVDQCSQLWKVQELPLNSISTAASQAAKQLLQHTGLLRRFSEMQLESRLRARRTGRSSSAAFSWVFKRDVQLS